MHQREPGLWGLLSGSEGSLELPGAQPSLWPSRQAALLWQSISSLFVAPSLSPFPSLLPGGKAAIVMGFEICI